jgi:hypothetical protein
MQQLSRSKDLLDASTEISGHFPMTSSWINGLGDNMSCDDESLCRLWNAVTSFGPIASFSHIIGSFLGFMYYNYFVRQIAKLYFLTPVLTGELGGWGGKSLPEICAQLTQVGQPFWEKNVQECSNLVERRFLGVLGLVEGILILFVLYRMINGVLAFIGSVWKLIFRLIGFCWRRRPKFVHAIFPPTPTTVPNHTSSTAYQLHAANTP